MLFRSSKLRTNAGTIENKGFEFALSADVIKNKNFSWVSSLNVTFNQNKVLKLSEDLLISDDSGFEYNNISVEGKSLAQLYLYPTAGIDKETGRRIFINKDGDKVLFHKDSGNNNVFTYPDGTIYSEGLDGLEQTICGNTLPKYYGGWTNTCSYKGFDLNVFFQFSGGNYIYNGTKATSSDMRFWNNSTDVMRNAWSETNKNGTYERPVDGENVSNGSAM